LKTKVVQLEIDDNLELILSDIDVDFK